VQSARHLEAAEKKPRECPESMPLLSKMLSIGRLAKLILGQNGSEWLLKERTRTGVPKRLVKADLLLSRGGSLLPVLIDA
jgi:hypothetical protein